MVASLEQRQPGWHTLARLEHAANAGRPRCLQIIDDAHRSFPLPVERHVSVL
jgi:hypothetical protein